MSPNIVFRTAADVLGAQYNHRFRSSVPPPSFASAAEVTAVAELVALSEKYRTVGALHPLHPSDFSNTEWLPHSGEQHRSQAAKSRQWLWGEVLGGSCCNKLRKVTSI